jgi:hypothetical protein
VNAGSGGRAAVPAHGVATGAGLVIGGLMLLLTAAVVWLQRRVPPPRRR